MFNGKKVICLGERDGIPGPAIAECVRAARGKEHIPPEVYEAQVGMMEMVLNVEKLSQVVEKVRRDGSKMV